MAAEGGHIDFVFLAPPPHPYPATGSATASDGFGICDGFTSLGLRLYNGPLRDNIENIWKHT